MIRGLAALLLVLSAAAASAEPITDGFETEGLGNLWNPRYATPGRVTVQREVVHSGSAALRVEIHEGDVPMVGAEGTETERTEVQEADALTPHLGETHEYGFSMYVPADFPIVETRLVTAQWHQRCVACLKRSPVVAQRYRRGVLSITVDSASGRTTVYRYPGKIQGRWIDLRYRIRFGLTDGAVAVWLDGTQVVDYKGPLGYPDDGPEVDFRFGLYRDRLATPMVIYFDDFRKERLAQ
ncbi:MAG TPA: polysaccharide lyase [Methylomirabilota bacterium]